MKQILRLTTTLIVLLFLGGNAWGQIYYHNFGTTAITAKPYTVAPTTFDANLSASSWTTNQTAFAGLAGNGGSGSGCLSVNNSSSATFTLTFNVAAGYQLSVTSFNFWRVRSGTGAQNWSMTINGTAVGSGTIPSTGALLGQTNVTNAISGLTGTITVVYTMTGASGTGTSRLDDFTLNGTVTATSVTPPTTQASNIGFSSIVETGMNASWTNGDGAKRVVIMNTSNSFTDPTDGTDPTANTAYSGSGEQVVYNNNNNSVVVTGLSASTTYWFRVYEYNGSGGATKYLTTTSTNNPNSQTTNAAVPMLAITGTPTNHGSVCPNTAATPVQYTITNTGTVAAVNIDVASNDAQFVVSGLSSTTIAALGGTATYNVTFTPASAGAKSATITVTSTTSGSNSPTSSLTGTGATAVAQAVTSSAATSVFNTKATLNGNVTTLGVCPATSEKGFVYSLTATNADPLVGGSGVAKTSVDGLTAGPFSLPLTGFTSNTGYSFKAYVFDGTDYTYGSALTFTTNLPATKLAFGTAPPSTGSVATNLTAFTVQALRADNSVDGEYTGNITVAKVSGAGNIGGTLTIAAVAGTATFSLVQFDAIGTYTINATASGITDAPTSGNIVITLTPATAIVFSGANAVSNCVSGGSGTWITNNNWCGGILPSSTTVAQFGADGTNGTLSFNMNTPPAGSKDIGAIEFTSANTIDRNLVNSSPSADGDITLFGVVLNGVPNVIIRNNSSSLFSITSSSRKIGVILGNATNNIINIDGTGGITINAIISGSGKNLTLDGAGTGVLALEGANTYTGITTVNSGTLRLNFSGGNTIPSTNDIVVNNGGTLQISSNQAFNSLVINSGGVVVVDAGATLTINTGNNITVHPGAQLTVNGTLANNAGNAGLVIKSDATGTGSLIHSTAGVSGTVERYITAANWAAVDNGWHLLSSPVSAQSISGDWTPSGTNNDYDIYVFDESKTTEYWLNQKVPANNITSFGVGKGYLVAYEQSGARSFTGELNASDVTLSGLANTSGSAYPGWHLLGNPFASAVRWTQGDWSKSNIGTYAQVWNSTAMSYKVLAGAGAGDIPAMNGFMVYTSGSGSITIPIDARVHSDSTWYKAGDEKQILLAAFDLDKGGYQETILRFTAGALPGFDMIEDCAFLAGFAPSFYSTSGSNAMALNTLPEMTHETQVPLGFIKNESENFSIVMQQPITDAVVYLTDKKTNTVYNLTQNPVYTFTSAEGDDPARFELKFGSVGIDDPATAPSINAWYNAGTLYVANQTGVTNINVFNVQGQQVQQARVQGSGLQTISLQLPAGVYIAQLVNNGNRETVKLIVQ